MIATLLCALLLAAPESPADGTTNPVYDLVTKVGVRVPGLPNPVTQPTPLLRPGVAPTADEAAKAVEAAAGKLPLELFTKASDAAPISLKIEAVEDAGGIRRAQSIRLAFLAHGVRGDPAADDFAGLLSSVKNPSGPKTLTRVELAARKIPHLEGPGREEHFSYSESVVLDAVQLAVVTRTVTTTVGPSTLAAITIDERFAGDAAYANCWRSIGRGAAAGQLGPPLPYAGLGGYVHTVKLPTPSGAVLVEMRLTFAEPAEWFGGPNQLRSKLPIAIQDNVKALRKALASGPKP